MSDIIPIDTAIHHLRAEDDDKIMVARYLKGAISSAENFMGRKIVLDNPSDDDVVFSPAIEIGILLILGDLYANRENTAVGTVAELPMGARFHLQPYRKMGV